MSIYWKYDEKKMKIYIDSKINKDLSDEFRTNINTPKKAILYMPIHNSNDILEWYRIFNDAYYYSDDVLYKNYIDNIGHGIGITLYSNKDRAKTIKAWYPNLIEVKASSSDEYIYLYEDDIYYRYSKDFFDNLETNGTDYYFNVGKDLFVDNVDIKIGEKVLLKNQDKSYLFFIELDNNALDANNNNYINNININNINRSISFNIKNYVDVELPDNIGINLTKTFNVGDTLVCIGDDNTIHEYNIEKVTIVNNGTDSDITIQIEEEINREHCKYISSKENGYYVKIYYNYSGNEIDYNQQNGVYLYDNDKLTLISEMFNEFKTYNQIVYTYQGDQMNNIYYLRRVEEKFTKYYSQYPTSNPLEDRNHDAINMNYSLGEPYLIECEVNYDIAMNPTDFSNINADCTYYNTNYDFMDHPDHDPPYDLEESIFRLLYTDYDVARKLQWKSEIGPVDFVLDEDMDTIQLVDIPNSNYSDLSFEIPTNNDFFNGFQEKNHYLHKFLDANSVDKTQVTKLDFNFETSGLTVVKQSPNSIVNLISPYAIEFIDVDDSNNDFIAGDGYFNIDITGYRLDGNNDKIKIFSFNENIFADYQRTGNNIILDTILYYLYPLFDDKNLINLFDSINGATDFEFTITRLDKCVIDTNINNPSEAARNSINKMFSVINKTIIGKVYDFGMEPTVDINGIIVGYNLILNKIKQNNNIYIYDDVHQNIKDNNGNEVNIIPNFRNVYDPNYTIKQYFEEYLDPGNSLDYNKQIDSRIPTNAQIDINMYGPDDNPGDMDYKYVIYGKNIKVTYSNYFKLFKNSTGDGTVIEYGSDYHDYFMKNIKHNTYCDITVDSNPPISNFVISHEYDFQYNVGRIIFKDKISFNGNTSKFGFDPQYNTIALSNDLENIFDTKENIMNNGVYKTMKPSTYNYANDLINYRHHYTHLTGVVYKEFNEMVYTFFKRDKKFSFDEDQIVDIYYDIATINPGNYNPGDIVYSNIDKKLYEVIDNITAMEIQINEKTYYNDISSSPINDETLYKYIMLFEYNGQIHKRIKTRRIKKDPRLNITFKRAAKLGVNNDHQPFIPIDLLNGIVETEENLISLNSGLGLGGSIRFINGLSYNKILNNIDGQGQYAWILHPNVITSNAVVGKDANGKLIWYTGIWYDGVWCDGIWYQGIWYNGIWVNGEMYAYDIIDNISSVTVLFNNPNINLTTWHNGDHIKGEFHNGIMKNVMWHNGEMYGGIIEDGIWKKGQLYDGTIEHIRWLYGEMYGGNWETGVWEDGLLYGGVFGGGAYISDDFRTRAIWRNGIAHVPSLIHNPEFTTKNGEHNATIIYNGIFKSKLTSGTIVSANYSGSNIVHGIIIGGYYMTGSDLDIINNINSNMFEVNPEQWDELLFGIDPNNNIQNFEPNDKHNYLPYNKDVYIMAERTVTNSTDDIFVHDVFINNQNDPLAVKFELNINNFTNTIMMYDNIINTIPNINFVIPGDFNSNGKPFITNIIEDETNIGNSTVLKIYAYGKNKTITIKSSIIVDGYTYNCNIKNN